MKTKTAFLVLALCAMASAALAAEADDVILFSASYAQGVRAEVAKGGGAPLRGKMTVAPGEGLDAASTGVAPLQYPAAGNVSDEAGTIEFRYKPALPDHPEAAQGTIFAQFIRVNAGGPDYNGLSIGINVKPGNKKYLWAIVKPREAGQKNAEILREVSIENGRWYRVAFCWDKEQLALFFDGKLLGVCPRPKNVLGGDTITIGGAHEKQVALGYLADARIAGRALYSAEQLPPAFAGCVEILWPGAPGKVVLREHASHPISAEQFAAMVDATAPVTLRVKTGKFPVVEGRTYAVNCTDRPPMYLVAGAGGLLDITLDRERNFCGLIAAEVPAGDLLAGAAWEGKVSDVTRPAMGWGHEGVAEAADIGKAQDSCGRAARDPALRRGADPSFHIEKTARGGEVTWRSAAVPVEAGKEYLVSGWYHVAEPCFGAVSLFRAVLSGPGLPDITREETGLNPLIAPLFDQTWRYAQFRFTAPRGYTAARVTLTQRGAAQKIWWDEIRLRPAPRPIVNAGRPIAPGDLQPLHSVSDVRAAWKDRPAPAIKVVPRGAFPQLTRDGRPLPLFAYNQYVSKPGDNESRRMFQAGLRWQFVRVTHYQKEWWLGRGKYDFSEIQDNIEAALRYEPDAAIMLDVKITPWYRAWGEEYPDAVWRDHDGRRVAGYKSSIHKPEKLGDGPNDRWAPSYSAPDFRTSVAEALEALAAHLKTFEAGKAVAGAALWCGTDNQWFPHVHYKGFDYSPGATQDFRRWLRAEYGGDAAALRRAWGDATVTFETAEYAPFALRDAPGFFLNPRDGADRRAFDSNRHSDEGVMESINTLAGAFKKAMGRPVFVCVYAPDIQQGYSGRSGRRLLLESPALDGIVSVPEYGPWRPAGATGNFASTIASLSLHGKVFLSELDYRTHVGWLGADAFYYLYYGHGGAMDEQHFSGLARRDAAMLAAQGGGSWFLVMNPYAFNTGAYLASVAELARAHKSAAESPMPQDRGQIAVFQDENTRNATRYSYGPALNNVSIGLARVALGRSGATWDPYYLSDLDNPARPRYKVHLFLSAPTITARQITWVRDNLQRDGNVLVFVNAAGVCSDAGAFDQNIRDLTGMTIRIDPTQAGVYYTSPVATQDKMGQGLRDNVMTELKQPLVWVDDPEATPIGAIAGVGKTGWAIKRFKDWTSVYIALPGNLTPELLRNIVREAGMQPIGPCNDVTYAGNGFVALHALYRGEKTLTFAAERRLADLGSGQVLAPARRLTFAMKAGETRWFRDVAP